MLYGVFDGDQRVNLGPWTSAKLAEDARQGLALGDRYTVRQLCPNHTWQAADTCTETHLA
jgi:hypothetical protein